MAYELQFADLGEYLGMFASGAATTLGLTAVSTALGIGVGVAGAAASDSRHAWLRSLTRGYVEAIRNTPFIVQLFFVFFGLPALGVHLGEFTAAILAMTLNLGAYSVEIIRAGLDSVPKNQIEAGQCLGLSGWQVFRHILLPPALRNAYPAVTSQFVLLLLGTSLASQVAADELFHVAGFIESRTYRSFEVYAVICVVYFAMAMSFKALFAIIGLAAFRWPRRR